MNQPQKNPMGRPVVPLLDLKAQYVQLEDEISDALREVCASQYFILGPGVKKLEELARKAGKDNMEFHYFDGLDHSLGIAAYFTKGVLPDGHQAIFEYIRRQIRIK